MGSAVGKVFSRKPAKIEFMESTKMPNAKEVDTRRRNSLMFFMRDWQELTTFEQQEASMVQVCAHDEGVRHCFVVAPRSVVGMMDQNGNERVRVKILATRTGIYSIDTVFDVQYFVSMLSTYVRMYRCRQSATSFHMDYRYS